MKFSSLGSSYKGGVGDAGLVSHPEESYYNEKGCGVPTLM